MKFLFSFLFIALFGLGLQAQEEMTEDTKKYNYVKIHKNFRFESMPNLIFNGNDFNYFVQRQNFFAAGFGASYSRHLKNGDFFEIGLAEFMIGNNTKATTWTEGDSLVYGRINDIEYKRLDLIFEINYALNLVESQSGKWRFLAGASLMPFLQSFDLEPQADGFPVAINIVGATFTAYPAFQVKVFDNGWLDIRLPFQLMRFAGVAGSNEDDFLNLFEERQRTTDFEALPSIYEIRVGLAFGF